MTRGCGLSRSARRFASLSKSALPSCNCFLPSVSRGISKNCLISPSRSPAATKSANSDMPSASIRSVAGTSGFESWIAAYSSGLPHRMRDNAFSSRANDGVRTARSCSRPPRSGTICDQSFACANHPAWHPAWTNDMSLSCCSAPRCTCLPPIFTKNSANHAPHRASTPFSDTTRTRPSRELVGGGEHIGCSPTASTRGCASRSAVAAGAFSEVTSIHSGAARHGSSSAVYSRITAGVMGIGTEKTTTSHFATNSVLAVESPSASMPMTSASGYSPPNRSMSHLPYSPAAPTTPIAAGVVRAATSAPAIASTPDCDIAVQCVFPFRCLTQSHSQWRMSSSRRLALPLPTSLTPTGIPAHAPCDK
eukprot:m.245303 g.245303  ORF g.245303 m.245303 type:complete len:364 (-) comp26400_c0_seq4:1767-2858(-)